MDQMNFVPEEPSNGSDEEGEKTLFINELEKGLYFDNLIVGVRGTEAQTDKNGNTYYKVEYTDKTGDIEGKIWSDSIPNVDKETLEEGSIVVLKGSVSEYRGSLQVVINSQRKADNGEFSMSDIVTQTKWSIDELEKELSSFIDEIEDSEIKELVNKLMKTHGTDFKTGPAAERLHHGYRGGLLEHVVELLSYAKSMRKFYKEINFDLVYTGIIFHDVGKIRELDISSFANARTISGKLKGHLIQSYDILHEIADENFDKDKLLQLEHIILSHHGLLEYGSPVVPKTIEAILVHKIDNLSSSVKQFSRVREENENSDSDFSKKDWALNTEVYLK